MMAANKISRLIEIQAELDRLSRDSASVQPTDRLAAINRRMSELKAEREEIEEEPGGGGAMVPKPG